MTMFSRFMKDESGATAIEYGLIAALIGVGIIVVLQNVRGELQNTFTKVQTEVEVRARQRSIWKRLEQELQAFFFCPLSPPGRGAR